MPNNQKNTGMQDKNRQDNTRSNPNQDKGSRQASGREDQQQSTRSGQGRNEDQRNTGGSNRSNDR